MEYHHRWSNGRKISLPVGKVVCVGRNYASHARELNNPIPDEALLFMKPNSAMVPMNAPIRIPTAKGAVHHEAEISVLIGNKITRNDLSQACFGIIGIGAALDLTLRDLQAELKKKGHPWEKAKSFDGSCPLSRFEPLDSFASLDDIPIELRIDDQIRQQGSSAQMLFSIPALMEYIVYHFTLFPGDVVLTGTPAGVGPLHPGMRLQIRLGDILTVQSTVVGQDP